MPIPIVCACGAKLQAPEKAAGRGVKCPKCTSVVKVPAAAGQPAALAATAARPSTPPAAAGRSGVEAPSGRPAYTVAPDGWIEINQAYVPPAGGGDGAALGGKGAAGGGDWGQRLLAAHEIPDEMQEQIRGQLTQNERLLWADRPQLDILLARARSLQLGGGIACLVVVVVLCIIGFFLLQMKESSKYIGVGVVGFMAVVFSGVFVLVIGAPARVRKGAATRSCYALTNRRLLVHPGSGAQMSVSSGGNAAAVDFSGVQRGVVSYSGLELQNMMRVEEKRFEGSGDLVLGRNVFDQPVGGRLTALGNVRDAEKLIREKLLHPIFEKLLRGELSLKDGFGRSEKERKQAKGEDEGEMLPVDGNIKDLMEKDNFAADPSNVKAYRSAIQEDLGQIAEELREKVDGELTAGEELLWVGEPEGSTKGRGMLGAMIGAATRKEPSYYLYAITNRRVLLFATKSTSVGNTVTLGAAKPQGPITYYPPSLLQAGLEDDKRIPKGGSIIFKSVKVKITTTDKNRRVTSTKVENHFFGILRIRNLKPVARLLFDTLIHPCRN
jgi:hypothetical protein